MNKSTQQNCFGIAIAVVSLSTVSMRADAAEIYFTPRVVRYFDNFLSLDSSTSADPSPAQGWLDSFDDALRSLLGPAADLSIVSADVAFKSEQAAYDLAGASLEFVWENGRTHQDRWIVTALTGNAEVKTDLLTLTVVDFSFGPLQSSDIWSSHEVSTADLDRTDIELSLEHGLTENLALIGGLRYERVEFDYIGRQQTLISQNLINVINAVIGEPTVFDLGLIEGTTRGTARPELYSVRFGGAARTGGARENTHDLYASAQLHLTYSPTAEATSTLTPADPSLPTFTLQSKVDDHWNGGPDIIVGYELRVSARVRLGVRYRCTVYVPLSGQLQSDDPRVNHGINIGLSVQLH